MLRAYLRARSRKIEGHIMHCIHVAEIRERLSPLEEEHAKAYLKLVGNQMKTCVTNKLPGKLGWVHFIAEISRVVHGSI